MRHPRHPRRVIRSRPYRFSSGAAVPVLETRGRLLARMGGARLSSPVAHGCGRDDCLRNWWRREIHRTTPERSQGVTISGGRASWLHNICENSRSRAPSGTRHWPGASRISMAARAARTASSVRSTPRGRRRGRSQSCGSRWRDLPLLVIDAPQTPQKRNRSRLLLQWGHTCTTDRAYGEMANAPRGRKPVRLPEVIASLNRKVESTPTPRNGGPSPQVPSVLVAEEAFGANHPTTSVGFAKALPADAPRLPHAPRERDR
jgi:hypothetical protein